MATFNLEVLAHDMLSAFIAHLQQDGAWLLPKLKATAKTELHSIAERIIEINTLVASGKIDHARAQELFAMQKEAAESQLLALEGTAITLIQNSMNAALNAIRQTVNNLLGWPLL